jgi:quercetin dioxygenase-like cupin family protein
MTFAQDGYHLGAEDGDSWWFLDTRMVVKVGAKQSGGAFTLIEWCAPAGFGPPRHVHQQEDEVFYVMEGEMRVVCGSKTWEASTGSLVFLPRGIEHAFIVLGEAPIRGLQITSPADFEDFVAEVGRRPETPGLPTPQMPDIARLNEVALRRGSPTVGPPLHI